MTIARIVLAAGLVAILLNACGGSDSGKTGTSTADLPLTQYVLPMIGTDQSPALDPALAQAEVQNSQLGNKSEDLGGGFTTPAASLPAGMVQWGPDTPPIPNVSTPPVYHYSQSSITGFSLTHLSGVGCVGGGALPVMPFAGTANGAASFSHANETAGPGNYSIKLDSGINVELTATLRTGLARFTWQRGQSANLTLIATSNAGGDGAITRNANTTPWLYQAG